MLKVIIVDDEEKNVLTLKTIINDYCTDLTVCGTAENIDAAQLLIRKVSPQIVFLDIQMPHGSGFDLLERLEQVDFELIFVTAFDQYAIDAFKYASVDYLLKPISISRFREAVARAGKRIEEKSNAANYLQLRQRLKELKANDERILLSDNQQQDLVKFEDIAYCIADGSYTSIYLKTGKRYVSSKNLKEFEEILPPALFYRIHHGHLVNLQFIRTYKKARIGTVLMKDGMELEVAARRKNSFFLRLSESGVYLPGL